MLPRTGAASITDGPPVQAGYELWQEAANARGGVNVSYTLGGQPASQQFEVELVICDDASNNVTHERWAARERCRQRGGAPRFCASLAGF